MMNSPIKSLLPALALYGASASAYGTMMGNGSKSVHVKPVKKLQLKGLSSEEMGTKGNGKKLSRAQRKNKNKRR